MKRASYHTDLTDEEWAKLEPLIPPAKPGGRRREVDMREILNAAFYVRDGGCSWRLLPHDLPPWQTVYTYVHGWKKDGTWERMVAVAGRDASDAKDFGCPLSGARKTGPARHLPPWPGDGDLHQQPAA